MNSRSSSLQRSGRGRLPVAVLAAGVAVSLLAGCGSRLERDEILAGGTAGVANGAGVPVTQADGTVVTPEGTVTAPDGTVVTPEGTVTAPDGTAVTPDGTTPDATTPDGTTPDAGPAAPGADPAAPGAPAPGAPAPGAPAPGAGGFATDDSAAIFGGTSCKPANLSTVKLGNVSTLSGVLGELFSPVVPALQTFVKAQNACGGLNGHPISLVVGDDQGDPSTAVSVANRQIQSDKIQAFLGNIQVLTVDAMVSVVNNSKVPIIGGDLTNNTWFSQALIFPQGPPPQSLSYAMVEQTKKRFNKTKAASVYCAEVPQACAQINKAINELAAGQGVQIVNSTRISITSPSYGSQCNTLKEAGAEVVYLIFDAAAQVRFTNDCAKVNYKPQYMAYALGVGNEQQFLGNPSLGGTLVPLNVFSWTAKATPAEKFWQASVAKFNPGFTSGNAASLGWVSGALAVAGSSKLGATPTSAQFVEGLRTLRANDLGGLTSPLTYRASGGPKIPYCTFYMSANADNSAWETPTSKATCSTVRAPSDPNK